MDLLGKQIESLVPQWHIVAEVGEALQAIHGDDQSISVFCVRRNSLQEQAVRLLSQAGATP